MVFQRKSAGSRRRGIVLLVVLSMLTLFAIVGLTFVLYAESEAESGRINRDSESFSAVGGPDMDRDQSFNLFLGQLIYGLDDTINVNSALRGQSLAETMYGSFDANGPLATGGANLAASDVPYDGTGRLHETVTVNGQPVDGYNLVNYTYFQADNFLRDPSRLGTRLDNKAATPRGQYTGGQNAPYTYPDLNSMFLASINASTGKVTVPSFHRPWNNLTAPTAAFNDPNNPFWTSAQGKYLTLRASPQAIGVPLPSQSDPNAITGDVKNLVTAPGGNDSVWLDIGAPILTTASGLRYKMLVAPLVLDLDNRVNLNVAGNILANGNLHASNQGWGPWEVNMSKVLNANATEWQNIFIGNSTYCRYGSGKLPTSTFALAGPTPHVYAPGDLDALIDQGGAAYSVTGTGTGPYTMPTLGNGFFASFDTNAYLNGLLVEHQNSATPPKLNHPMYYNPMQSTGTNRVMPVSAIASLLWAGVNASPNSDLVQLCPTNYSKTNPTLAQRIIDETTTLSMDLDRPGAAPYIYDQTNAYTVADANGVVYKVTGPGNGAYTSAGVSAQTFPTVSPLPRQAAPAIQGEFDPSTWRSVLAATLSRADLNRPLATYPASGVQPADRQQFAQDIFNRLTAVTGMSAAYNGGNLGSANPQQYATLRWLAQLSANVVDYIDTDDAMTAFQWAPTPLGTDTGYVFGTELPKLVVNEVYLEYNNDSGDPNKINNPNVPPVPPQINAATQPYHMNVWTELVNPLPSTPETAPNPANNANLVNGTTPIYQLVITGQNNNLRSAGNLVGDPDNAKQPYTVASGYSSAGGPGQILAVVGNWGGVQNVTPVGTSQSSAPGGPNSNSGFLVIGPTNPTGPGTPAQIQTSVTANNMSYTIANGDANANTPPAPTILLQRLANPNLAPNAVTNPYVTVDYVDMQQVSAVVKSSTVNDARQYNSQGTNGNWVSNPNNRYSFGRNQPYAAVATAWAQQHLSNGQTLTTNQPTTTFYSVNNPAASPDWLVHLDRPLISPIELLHVSGFKPHELTQQFYKDASNNYAYMTPWTNQNFLLYRLLEFVKTSNPTPGVVNGGRVPGKININTLDASPDPNNNGLPTSTAVFEALCDAQPGNTTYNSSGTGTTDAYVDQVFQQLMAQRTPNGTPGQNDRPFWGMAAGVDGPDTQYPAAQYPNGLGIANTLLNTTLTNGASPYNNTTHPYQKLELLRKLFNNVTTRSNTFAVWLTVGFFQVTNDQTQPVKLGAEINAAQGKNIRHHMFAIVDRTQLQTWPTGAVTTTVNVVPGNQPLTMLSTLTPMDSLRTGRTWQIQPGTSLVFDQGVSNFGAGTVNEETVVVQQDGSVTFQYPHPAGKPVISRGHPGPWKNYDRTSDGQVVPYSVIID